MFGDELARLDPQHPDVGEPGPVYAAAGLPAPLVVEIYGDKVPVGMVCGGPGDKVADPAADLQGKGVVVAEQGAPVDRGRQFVRPEIIGGFDMDDGLGQFLPAVRAVVFPGYHRNCRRRRAILTRFSAERQRFAAIVAIAIYSAV